MANTAKKVEDAVSGATEKVRDVASSLPGQAREAASSAGQTASDLAATASRKADDAAASLGESVRSMAETVRDRGPQSGMLGTATARVADSLESTGDYLREEGFSGMASDLTELIRRNPIPAMLVGIGIGFLLARMTRS
jgi:hypothetical protein